LEQPDLAGYARYLFLLSSGYQRVPGLNSTLARWPPRGLLVKVERYVRTTDDR